MGKEQIGFHSNGTARDDGIDFKSYEGRWVIADRKGSNPIAGYLRSVTKDGLLLKPYQIIDFSGGNKNFVIRETGLPLLIEKIEVTGIGETTKDNIQGFCDYNNRETQRDEYKRRADFQNAFPRQRIVIAKR